METGKATGHHRRRRRHRRRHGIVGLKRPRLGKNPLLTVLLILTALAVGYYMTGLLESQASLPDSAATS